MLPYFNNICSLVCTLLQLFLKHAIKTESISIQMKQFVSINKKIQLIKLRTYLHSLVIITSNIKCDCGLHHIFRPKLVRSLFLRPNCPLVHYPASFIRCSFVRGPFVRCPFVRDSFVWGPCVLVLICPEPICPKTVCIHTPSAIILHRCVIFYWLCTSRPKISSRVFICKFSLTE